MQRTPEDYDIGYVRTCTEHVAEIVDWYTVNTVATRVIKPKCTPRGYQIRRQPLTALGPLELLIYTIESNITK